MKMETTLAFAEECQRYNRRSKLFYVTCDFVDIPQIDEKTGVYFNVHSDPLNISIDQNSTKSIADKKKKHRKSQLFYVSCEHFDVNHDASRQSSISSQDDCSIELSDPLSNVLIDDQMDALNGFDSSVLMFGNQSDSTPINSGRSTPSSVRRRPKRPDIQVPKHVVYRDYVEIKRPDSLYSESDRTSVISESSYLDLSEDVVKAVLSSISDKNEFEDTLRKETDNSDLNLKQTEMTELCESRPNSPTSTFLKKLITPNSNETIISQLHCKLSPILHKLKKLEAQSKTLSALQVKLAVVQEEKRQLSDMLKLKRRRNSENELDLTYKLEQQSKCKELTFSKINQTEFYSKQKKLSFSAMDQIDVGHTNCASKGTNTSNSVSRDAAIQINMDVSSNRCSKATNTDAVSHTSVGINSSVISFDKSAQFCQEVRDFICQNKLESFDKETETERVSFADNSCGSEINFSDNSTQATPSLGTVSTQSADILFQHKDTMCGTSFSSLKDSGIGDNVADIIIKTTDTQCNPIIMKNSCTEISVDSRDEQNEIGCSFSLMKSAWTQNIVDKNDFACGNNIADICRNDAGVSFVPQMQNQLSNTEIICQLDATTLCDIQSPVSHIGVGEDSVFDIFCEKCSNMETRTLCVGNYLNDQNCCVDDKLCSCDKPLMESIAVGDHTVDDVCCDKCENIAVADICVHARVTTKSIGVGEGDVTKELCEKCELNGDMFNFDLNILHASSSIEFQQQQQQPALCHYCGNKVDLNDAELDNNLQAMRESMTRVPAGMKRSTVSRTLNYIEHEEESCYRETENDSMATGNFSDEEEEEISEKGNDDVIESCKMLHAHFSGAKPLKQTAMMKYMGSIQALWFKTLKRRRANAAVVKSYIDLFQQRIPELLETIVNLSDDEGNTALHYAITYKNYAVVSILLDSGECCVDLINQAGYSPIMLAGLAGYEKKNDKYILQRLFRMGDVNKPSAEAGETALMLAVSRGKQNVVDIMLDVGCDINAVDDDGLTALMVACEQGNVQIVKALLANPDCDVTIEDNEGSTALSIAMDARRKDLALLIYGSLNFDARGRIKLSPSKQSLLGLGRRSPSPVIGKM